MKQPTILLFGNFDISGGPFDNRFLVVLSDAEVLDETARLFVGSDQLDDPFEYWPTAFELFTSQPTGITYPQLVTPSGEALRSYAERGYGWIQPAHSTTLDVHSRNRGNVVASETNDGVVLLKPAC